MSLRSACTANRWMGLALLAVVLFGCGGGTADGDGTTAATAVTRSERVEPMTRSAAQHEEASPFKQRRPEASPSPHSLRLAKLSSTKMAALTAEGPRVGTPRKIGFPRDSAATASTDATARRLQWQRSEKGGVVASISLSSEGAAGVRLGLWVKSLPWEAVVRVYAQSSNQVFEVSGSDILSTVHRNIDAEGDSDRARTYWTPVIEGEESTLEIELPPGTGPETVEVAIPRLSHLFELPSAQSKAQVAKIGGSEYCEIDISCTTDFPIERNATAKMSFVASDGLSYVCTGTLVNDRQGSGTPYFLSARHCISSQSEASSMNTFWFYRSSSCNSGTLSANTKTLARGATLLYQSAATDTSFMRLNDTPPTGTTYAGWDASAPAVGASLVGIHHPSGDLQKISYGALKGFTACTAIGTQDSFTCSSSTQALGSFLSTQWSRGVTEAGSSGSGLYKTVSGTNYLVGQLYGGSSSCASPTAKDDYGRFDVAYKAALSQWLDNATVVSRDAVYRFYNTQTSTHFFTVLAAERDYVRTYLPQYQYEGAAFYAYANTGSGLSAVYRFYNNLTSTHFYTINTAERDYVKASLPQFAYEGSSWYALTASSAAATPIYRFYNRTTSTHFYTVSAAERDYVIASLPQFTYEGISYYAWSSAN